MKKPSVLYLGTKEVCVDGLDLVYAQSSELIERKAYDLIVYPSEFNSSIVLPEYLKSTKAISFSKRKQSDINISYISYKRSMEIFLNSFKQQCSSRQLSGESEKISDLKSKIRRVNNAKCRVILITGEAGTGKEIVARSLVASNEVCVELNCAAIPEELLESELFGYEQGAFTGANRSKIGLIELANDGVIFLDEIAELSLKLQAKLLRVIEYRKFKRLGSTKDIYFKGRVIAATNRNLQKMIELNTFREDLFHRLSAINLDIPPLRHRKRFTDHI